MSNEEKQILGINATEPKAEAHTMMKWFEDSGANARQIVGEIRRSQVELQFPEPPERIQGTAPDQINVYSDGAVKSPSIRNFATSGFGIWWPKEDDGGPSRARKMEEVAKYTLVEEWPGGTAMWSPLRGTWHSSTRAELAALLLALHIEEPLHIGIDNKTLVDKANALIKKADERRGRDEESKVSKKPWKHKGMVTFGKKSGRQY